VQKSEFEYLHKDAGEWVVRSHAQASMRRLKPQTRNRTQARTAPRHGASRRAQPLPQTDDVMRPGLAGVPRFWPENLSQRASHKEGAWRLIWIGMLGTN